MPYAIVINIFIYWFSASIYMFGVWLDFNFGGATFDQILYHLQFGVGRLVKTDIFMLKSFIKSCLLFPIIPAILVGTSMLYLCNKYSPRRRSLVIMANVLPVLVLVGVTSVTLQKLSFWQYFDYRGSEAFYAQQYVAPSAITPPPSPRNLILIYVESLENTYSDIGMFGKDLLADINHATRTAQSFNEYRRADGSDWTIAGIVATQCGIPLRTFGFRGNRFGEALKAFLPNAMCLGDILKQAGYKNIFMGGATLKFAGKGTFFRSHGYDELYGQEEWAARGDTAFKYYWGLDDAALLRHARDRIEELEASNTLYNLTLLTLNTHHPTGSIHDDCALTGTPQFPVVLECTSQLLAQFLDGLKNDGYLRNTDVIMLGDHLAMANTLYPQMIRAPKRTIYNKFITAAPLEKNRDFLYPFDMYPSILYAMGFRFPESRAGLGLSGFGPVNQSLAINNVKNLGGKLMGDSERYRRFWETPHARSIALTPPSPISPGYAAGRHPSPSAPPYGTQATGSGSYIK